MSLNSLDNNDKQFFCMECQAVIISDDHTEAMTKHAYEHHATCEEAQKLYEAFEDMSCEVKILS